MLLLVADQFRYDYLERFRPLLDGGIGWLLENGVSFREARHRHARTQTGPGHATLATGCHPSRHGIVDNEWFDRRLGRVLYCVEDPRHGRSPELLEASGLGDWIAERGPGSKVYAVAGKDRAAILMGGHRADGAFWYDHDTGRLVSSGYYPGARLEWLEEFQRRPWVRRFFGTLWTPLEVEADLEELGIGSLDRGVFDLDFPHPIGPPTIAPDEGFYRAIYETPFVDAYVARFARELIVREEMGGDDRVDLLALGFSALDTVGHDFGPHGRETLDTLLRLDRVLGEILEFVDERIGLEHVVVAFSSDHGIPPIPESIAGPEGPDRRFDEEEILCFQRVWSRLEEAFGEDRWVHRGLYLDHETIARRGLETAEVADLVAGELRACESVEAVFTRAELESSPDGDEIRQAFAENVYPGRSPDLFVHFRTGVIRGSLRGTTHGTAHRYDTWVPMIVAAPDAAPGIVDVPVDTVDLAPTLASVLGIPVSGPVDGVDRSHLWSDRDAR